MKLVLTNKFNILKTDTIQITNGIYEFEYDMLYNDVKLDKWLEKVKNTTSDTKNIKIIYSGRDIFKAYVKALNKIRRKNIFEKFIRKKLNLYDVFLINLNKDDIDNIKTRLLELRENYEIQLENIYENKNLMNKIISIDRTCEILDKYCRGAPREVSNYLLERRRENIKNEIKLDRYSGFFFEEEVINKLSKYNYIAKIELMAGFLHTDKIIKGDVDGLLFHIENEHDKYPLIVIDSFIEIKLSNVNILPDIEKMSNLISLLLKNKMNIYFKKLGNYYVDNSLWMPNEESELVFNNNSFYKLSPDVNNIIKYNTIYIIHKTPRSSISFTYINGQDIKTIKKYIRKNEIYKIKTYISKSIEINFDNLDIFIDIMNQNNLLEFDDGKKLNYGIKN